MPPRLAGYSSVIRKKTTIEESVNRIFKLCDANLGNIYNFLDTISIDEHFKTFIKLCHSYNYQTFILSDGYEELITYILNKYKIQDTKVYANKMKNKNNRFYIDPIYKNLKCGRCGTCKKQLLELLRPNSCQTVYIGDGKSDICVSRYADILFAKDRLLQHCQLNDIPAIPFSSFNDIINWIEMRNS